MSQAGTEVGDERNKIEIAKAHVARHSPMLLTAASLFGALALRGGAATNLRFGARLES